LFLSAFITCQAASLSREGEKVRTEKREKKKKGRKKWRRHEGSGLHEKRKKGDKVTRLTNSVEEGEKKEKQTKGWWMQA
jgi:hypothetical protein